MSHVPWPTCCSCIPWRHHSSQHHLTCEMEMKMNVRHDEDAEKKWWWWLQESRLWTKIAGIFTSLSVTSLKDITERKGKYHSWGKNTILILDWCQVRLSSLGFLEAFGLLTSPITPAHSVYSIITHNVFFFYINTIWWLTLSIPPCYNHDTFYTLTYHTRATCKKLHAYTPHVVSWCVFYSPMQFLEPNIYIVFYLLFLVYRPLMAMQLISTNGHCNDNINRDTYVLWHIACEVFQIRRGFVDTGNLWGGHRRQCRHCCCYHRNRHHPCRCCCCSWTW